MKDNWPDFKDLPVFHKVTVEVQSFSSCAGVWSIGVIFQPTHVWQNLLFNFLLD